MNDCSRCSARSIVSTATVFAIASVSAIASAQAEPAGAAPVTMSPPQAAPDSGTTPPSGPTRASPTDPSTSAIVPSAAGAEPPGVATLTGPSATEPKSAPFAKWYEKIKLEGFVDAYASVNSHFPKPQSGQNIGRAFDTHNGFALHWAGLNASYAPDPVGATVALRFGPGAYTYNAAYDWGLGAGFVKQAFVSWKPGGGPITIDFGKFDTWIGAEAADTQLNMNYTRSFLFSGQTLFHTGLRVDFALSEQLDLKVFAVNGWNNTVDNNSGKSFGGSVGLTPAKFLSASLNWIGGPEQADMATSVTTGQLAPVAGANSRWRHLLDLVVDLHPEKLHAVLNADIGNEGMPLGSGNESKTTTWYGGNLTLGYAFSELFSAAVRGGYFKDPDGWALSQIVGVAAAAGHRSEWFDATLTLAASPTPNLLIKLDGRIDSATIDGVDGVFPKSPDSPPGKTMLTTTLGLVATTN